MTGRYTEYGLPAPTRAARLGFLCGIHAPPSDSTAGASRLPATDVRPSKQNLSDEIPGRGAPYPDSDKTARGGKLKLTH
ncbi:hypothetical protein GCM10022376_08390 [Yimella lutea]